MTINITNIQRFSLHDGPGIRTTVFLKGCTIRCPWCSNPENIYQYQQKYIKNGVEGFYGKDYETNDVFDEVIKDKNYYENEGGITFSGGEPLLQQKQLEPLLIKLKANSIHLALETSLYYPEIDIALKYIDLFIVDIKIMDESKCKSILGGDINEYKKNVEILGRRGKPIIFRIPVIGGYTDDKNNIEAVISFIKSIYFYNNIIKIEILKEHNFGLSKYKSIKMVDNSFRVPSYIGVDDEILSFYRNEIIQTIGNDIPVNICKLY